MATKDPGPAPMPKQILVGDKVRLHEGSAATYTRAYGHDVAEKHWTVTFIDRVFGRKRLYVDGTPSAIFAAHARLAYKPQSKTRREQLTKMGAKLP